MYRRPEPSEYSNFHAGYVALVLEEDILGVLAAQPQELRALAGGLDPGREQYRYAPGKWSVRQVLGHLVDGERVFGYRAFCIARGETQPLPGFDENAYVAAARSDERTAADLLDEFAAVRAGNLHALRHVPGEAWARIGTANGNPVSVRALAAIMAGHVRHHAAILHARYGLGGTAHTA